MDLMDFASKSDHELRLEHDQIVHDSAHAQSWLQLAHSEYGQFLLKYLKQQIEIIHHAYKKIPIESAATHLAALVGQEYTLERLVLKLESVETELEALDKRMSAIYNVLKERERHHNESNNSIIPKDVEREINARRE